MSFKLEVLPMCMSFCPHTMDNRKCKNFEPNSHLPRVCLHLRFGEYCTWVKLKCNVRKEKAA